MKNPKVRRKKEIIKIRGENLKKKKRTHIVLLILIPWEYNLIEFESSYILWQFSVTFNCQSSWYKILNIDINTVKTQG